MRRLLLLLLMTAAPLLAESTSVPPPLPPVLTPAPTGDEPGEQMHRYLQDEIDAAWVRWKASFETRTEPAAIRTHQTGLRAALVGALGGFPARTPLNARTTGTLERDGYRVEKITFESQPGFVVTPALFLPDPRRQAGPWPGDHPLRPLCSRQGPRRIPVDGRPARAERHGRARLRPDRPG